MATGACGINCDVCGLRVSGRCSSCGPGKSEQASAKLAAQVRLLGTPCAILECARSKGIDYCPRDCHHFPCKVFQRGPYPYSSDFLLMQERRREVTPDLNFPNTPVKVDPTHWRDLLALDPKEVVERCSCEWEEDRGYGVPFLGRTYWADPRLQSITPPQGEDLMEPHLPLVLVIYLLKAQDRPLDGRMITEREIPGGAFFFRHLHRLPIHHLEDTFGQDPEGFLSVGLNLGGRRLDVSEASFELLALPRIPVGFHLWGADEEFPAKCVITFDSSIHHHLPLDAIWALANVLAHRLIRTYREGAS